MTNATLYNFVGVHPLKYEFREQGLVAVVAPVDALHVVQTDVQSIQLECKAVVCRLVGPSVARSPSRFSLSLPFPQTPATLPLLTCGRSRWWVKFNVHSLQPSLTLPQTLDAAPAKCMFHVKKRRSRTCRRIFDYLTRIPDLGEKTNVQ